MGNNTFIYILQYRKSYDIKKYLILFIFFTLYSCCCYSQSIKGRVVDKKGNPVAFANVVLLSGKDSAFVKGTVSGKDGNFIIHYFCNKGILKVSAIGYKTLYRDYTGNDAEIIQMEEDTKVLKEVIVKSTLPKTILKDGGMLTIVAGSILEKIENMDQLLDRIPYVTAKDGTIKVFGRGTPEIYINGRKMRDKMELERLQPDEIKNIEVVTNPGARYDASVKSVIRITMKKPVGEGLGYDIKTDAKVNEQKRMSWLENFRLGYRKNGFDLNAQLYGIYGHIQDNKQFQQATDLEKTWKQTNNISQEYTNVNPYGRLAASYMLNEDNSLGASFSYDRYARHEDTGDMKSMTLCDDKLSELSKNHFVLPCRSTDLYTNTYYVGKVGKIGVDFNTDWYWAGNKDQMMNSEQYMQNGDETKNQEVNSKRYTYNTLLASKLVLTAPLLSGDLSCGSEYSATRRKSDYNVLPATLVDNENSLVKEYMTSAFIDYSRNFNKLSLQAGLRYEYVDFNYYDHGNYVLGQSKTYSNWFPSATLSCPVGKTQMQLSYASNIYRPSYYELRNGVQYDNRYTYESGNPFLVPSIMRNLSYNFSWKWLNFSTMYTHTSNDVCDLMQSYKDDPTIILMRPENMGSYDKIQASSSLQPIFGIWHPELEISVLKQWFKMETHNNVSLNHPVGVCNFNNTFDTKWITASLMMTAQTDGNMGNKFIRKGYFGTDISLYKSFCKNKLMLQLYASDIFGTADRRIVFYSGKQCISFIKDYSSSTISLTIRYRFNTTKNKYKGTGAGQEQRNRM